MIDKISRYCVARQNIMRILLFLIPFSLFLILNGTSVFDEFIQEDWLLVKNYTMTELLDTLKGPWSSIYRSEYFRPLTILSYAIDYKIFKTNFVGIHISHLIYYLIMLILIFRSTYKFSGNNFISVSTICLFLINPINSVHPMIITQRTDVLSMIFILSSFLLMMNKKYIFSSILYIFALLSKETSLIYIPFLYCLILFTSTFKNARLAYTKHFISTVILSCFYLIYRMSLPLEVSNHSYSLYSYFTANVNLIFSKESILNTEKIYYLIIIPLLMAFLFLINRQKPSNRRILATLFAITILFGMSSRIRLLVFPSLILCYYLSIILNQSLSKVSMTFSRHKVKHYIQITTISVVAIIWLHLTISDKKSYQYGTPYHKYANFVFYKKTRIIFLLKIYKHQFVHK